MNCSKNDGFHLTTLPYLFQSRFMEVLPYFAQIELAQTNQQFFKIYESRCKKRDISDSVKIVVDKKCIRINDVIYPHTLFKNKRGGKHYIKGNYFPTKFISISNVEKVAWCDVVILAKGLIKDGLYFQSKNQQKEVTKMLKADMIPNNGILKIEIGWPSNKNALIYSTETKNSRGLAHLA